MMKQEKNYYKVQVEKTADGWYVAEIPKTGIITQAKTLNELKTNVKDAVECMGQAKKKVGQEKVVETFGIVKLK